jgi:RNA polymerase sigma-70 factor (ECF subfamily)
VDQLNKIINGCLKGDRRCQEQLYTMFSTRMFGLCLQYADNQDDAADILQEGFIKVFRKLEQFGGKGSFEGWIRRIMINTALERYRSQVRLYPLTDNTVKKGDMIQEEVFERLSASDLIRLVQDLPPRYRMVFNLYAIEGYSHKEIGEMMGITVGTSKSNLSRARDILQQKVKQYFDTSENIIREK